MPLEHHRTGRGEPLILIHGIGCHWPVWTPVLGLLAAEREVYAIDLPGFGGSSPLPAGELPTVAALADAVAAWAAERGLERPHVAGNSLGGGVALHLGRTGRARSVTCLSPIGFWNERERAYSYAVLRSTLASAPLVARRADALTATAAGRTLLMGHMAARPWRWPAAAAAALFRVAGTAAFAPTLEHVIGWDYPGGDLDMPATVAWAQRDRLLIPRQRRRAQRRLAGAHHLVLEGCGHLPFYDDPAQVARIVLAGSAG